MNSSISSVRVGTGSYSFVDLGEGFDGDYDADDPDDVELLRLDYADDDASISGCTTVPASSTPATRYAILLLVKHFALTSNLSPKYVVEVFSHFDRSWLGSGVPESLGHIRFTDNQ